MVTWIVVAVVALSLVGLAVAVLSLAARLRPLEAATRRARVRAEQAERLEAGVSVLQQHALSLQERLEPLQRRR